MMDPRELPSPEVIQKDFEEFIQQKYGGNVRLFTTQVKVAAPEDGDHEKPNSKKPIDIQFDLKPRDVKNFLDKYVIRQDEAKKALAIAVCDHYNHIRECLASADARKRAYAKQNVLMLGPTGVGKTYLVRLVAELIGVPFVKADATRFSETGYVGANVEDLVKDLVVQAGGNIELAQYGIVYIDEADKLATPSNVAGRDVSGRGVQIGLLKLMEETEVDLRSSQDMASQIQSFMEFQSKGKVDRKVINTKHILFIVSGAFNGMKEIIRKRLEGGSMGINAPLSGKLADSRFLEKVGTQDFIHYGFEPEFIGRLPVHVVCQHLDEKDLYEILKSSEGSIIHQYEQAFGAYGIKVQFSELGLRAIAQIAHLEKTGARALMTVCEKALRDFKFELPSTLLKEFVVTDRLISNPKLELQKMLNEKLVAIQDVFREKVARVLVAFNFEHETQYVLDPVTIDSICQHSLEVGQEVEIYCRGVLLHFLEKSNRTKTPRELHWADLS